MPPDTAGAADLPIRLMSSCVAKNPKYKQVKVESREVNTILLLKNTLSLRLQGVITQCRFGTKGCGEVGIPEYDTPTRTHQIACLYLQS